MKASGIKEIKEELKALTHNELMNLCLSLAKYKVDNKELLGYLLFNAGNKEDYVAAIKAEVDQYFNELKEQKNLYYVKKGLRKILRLLSKYCKYINDKPVSVDLYIYFCKQIKQSGIPYHKSALLLNLYEQQLKKINTLVISLHEDLQQDYYRELEKLSLT